MFIFLDTAIGFGVRKPFSKAALLMLKKVQVARSLRVLFRIND